MTAIVPDFTDTGDGDYDDDDEQRQNSGDTYEAVDLEERRADLFAGLGPVAVFSARHRFSRPRWLKLVGGARHRSPGDTFNAQSTGGNDEDDDESFADPIQLVARWFGIELRGHGGGTATTVPPATVGHVRSNSQAQVNKLSIIYYISLYNTTLITVTYTYRFFIMDFVFIRLKLYYTCYFLKFHIK